jgi:catechol 2,3-dioxygenase-like lactoylglutathione lyase family enzyme
VARFPLAHVSWSIADNADRKPCDAFFQDVFGAETAYEMLITPEAEAMGLDREESLMMIGDTMVIPIAPAGKSVREGHPAGDMFRRSAAPMRWLGLALRVADLKAADAWFGERGFRLHYDRGMEEHYFLVSRGQALGVRLELLCHGLPNDPREDAGWTPAKWRDDHPLGLEGLQAIGVSVPALDEARALFGKTLELPELGERAVPEWHAQCAAFNLGDTVIEAMEGVPGSDIARHAAETKGIQSLTFKVKDAAAAAGYLRGKGLDLIGDVSGRFAIAPEQAQGRLIWLTGQTPEGYPPPGSQLREPGVL